MNEYRTNMATASGGETRKVLNLVNVIYQDGGIQSHGKDLPTPICEVFSNLVSAYDLYNELK